MPAGLRSLGSAESLQKEQEELKKLRKAGKGGFASQLRSKNKLVEDKIKELDEIQSKLAEKPPHLSAPLRNGYHDELELHRASLKEALEKLQNYSDSANMIKKKVVPSII
ncbi:unnamed protein product [Symbiodinium sp. CCMP2456]|nr:unnamed protein product [Symbiodinium sp. CCMP2456]